MKQLMNLTCKRVALAASFVVCALFANAQSPQAWQTSKDVQRIANKEMFNDDELQKSHINAVSSEYPIWALSKGVVFVSNNQSESFVGKGNIASTGYPMWTVSKGVARINNQSNIDNSDRENAPKNRSGMTVSKDVNNIKKKK